MADQLTAEERQAIDAAVARGEVTVIAPGRSAYEVIWDPQTATLRYVNPAHALRGVQRARARSQVVSAELRARREDVAGLVIDGMTVDEIAARLGLQPSLVRADIKASKLAVPNARMVAVARRRELVRKLVLAGHDAETIMAHPKVRISPTTLREDVVALGLKMPPRRPRMRLSAGRTMSLKRKLRLGKIARMVAEGNRHGEIAAACGVSPGTVANDIAELRAAGQLATTRNTSGLERRRKDVLRLRAEGMENTQIAASLGVSLRSVERDVTRAHAIGLADAPARSVSVVQRREVVRGLVGDGLSYAEIGIRLGVNAAVVAKDVRWLRAHGRAPDSRAGVRLRHETRAALATEIAGRIAGGSTQVALAAEFGLARSTVRKLLSEAEARAEAGAQAAAE